MILADPVQEAPRALPREGLPRTRPVGGRCCWSSRNGTALGCGWRRGGGRAEASHCARRVAGRLGWHRHQLPVPLPQRARGGCGRRLLQSAPLPVPVRARQGEASRSLRGWTGEQGPGLRSSRNSTFPPNPGAKPCVRRPRQPRDQRSIHSRRLAPHLARWQRRQHLSVASAGRRGRGAGACYALSNPLPVPRLLSGRLIAARPDPPVPRRGPAPPDTPGPGADPFFDLETFPIAHFPGGGQRHPCTHCIDPLAEPGCPSLDPDSRSLLRGNKPKAKSPPSPFVGRGWAPPGPCGGGD